MKATIHLVLVTALRDRMFGALFGILVLLTALSIFLGSTAIDEQLQMSVVFAAAGGRLVLVLGLTIFAAFHVQGLFETREVEAILSRAISRPAFVIAYWLGLACLATVLAGLFGISIASIAGWTTGAFIWVATLVAECWIVLAVALFAGLMLERATLTVMFTIGFYALARLMGFFVGIRETATDETIIPLVKRGLDAVLLFVPRLDLFAQTGWIVHGSGDTDILFLGVQTALFLALAVVAAIFDLRRKEF